MFTRSVGQAEDLHLTSRCRDGVERSKAFLDEGVLGCVAGFRVPPEPCVAVGDRTDGLPCDVVEEFLFTRREHNWRDGSGDYWLREMLRRPVRLDLSVEDREVLDRLR